MKKVLLLQYWTGKTQPIFQPGLHVMFRLYLKENRVILVPILKITYEEKKKACIRSDQTGTS